MCVGRNPPVQPPPPSARSAPLRRAPDRGAAPHHLTFPTPSPPQRVASFAQARAARCVCVCVFKQMSLPPLWQAVLFSNPTQVAALLKRTTAAKLNAAGPTGPPILFAAIEEHVHEAMGTGDYAGTAPRPVGGKTYEVLELLLRAGADPNAIFRNPLTGSVLVPLSVLAERGLPAVSLFLEHGRALDVMRPSAEERTRRCMWPLQLAIACGQEAVARALISHPSFDGARDPRPLLAAAEGDRLALVKLLLSRGAAAVVNARHPDPNCVCVCCARAAKKPTPFTLRPPPTLPNTQGAHPAVYSVLLRARLRVGTARGGRGPINPVPRRAPGGRRPRRPIPQAQPHGKRACHGCGAHAD